MSGAPSNISATRPKQRTRKAVGGFDTKDGLTKFDIWQQNEITLHKEFKRKIMGWLMFTFLGVNCIVLIFLIGIFIAEIYHDRSRILTERVLLALVAGSVAQLGALAYAVTKGLNAGTPMALAPRK